MTQKEYEEIIEDIKSSTEYIHDIKNIERCENNINYFIRKNALDCLHDMIHEYSRQINEFGTSIDGIIVKFGVDPNSLSDAEIRKQLKYISVHIPFYILYRKGEEALVKKLRDFIANKF